MRDKIIKEALGKIRYEQSSFGYLFTGGETSEQISKISEEFNQRVTDLAFKLVDDLAKLPGADKIYVRCPVCGEEYSSDQLMSPTPEKDLK